MSLTCHRTGICVVHCPGHKVENHRHLRLIKPIHTFPVRNLCGSIRLLKENSRRSKSRRRRETNCWKSRTEAEVVGQLGGMPWHHLSTFSRWSASRARISASARPTATWTARARSTTMRGARPGARAPCTNRFMLVIASRRMGWRLRHCSRARRPAPWSGGANWAAGGLGRGLGRAGLLCSLLRLICRSNDPSSGLGLEQFRRKAKR